MSREFLIWMRDHDFAQLIHEEDDERDTSGLFWERYGVRAFGINFWFDWQRNQLMEWITPNVVDFWRTFP